MSNQSFGRWAVARALGCGAALVLLVLASPGCGTGGGKAAVAPDAADNVATATGSDTLYAPRYAEGFVIRRTAGRSTVVTITDPWQNASGVRLDLFLERDGESVPDDFQGVAVKAPLKRVVCMSSSYVAFIDAIGELDAVKGVSGARYIFNDTLRARYERGEVKDVGYDGNVNYELVASLAPDLVMVYGIAGENEPLTRKLNELNIRHIYIGEYVEQLPLGKAEWLVAFGEMFDKRALAEQLFASTRDSYDSVRTLAARRLAGGPEGAPERTPSHSPEVMLNAPYRDTWFVPGDLSYMVRLITDAGGSYVCRGVESDRSRPIGSESAYLFASRSDVWLNPGQVTTKAELKSLYPRFAATRPVVGGRVYNCNLRATPAGGSDFWESGAVRPDIILRDLVKIMHPDALPDHKLFYFRHIN